MLAEKIHGGILRDTCCLPTSEHRGYDVVVGIIDCKVIRVPPVL